MRCLLDFGPGAGRAHLAWAPALFVALFTTGAALAELATFERSILHSLVAFLKHKHF
jgi:hypothetical protein